MPLRDYEYINQDPAAQRQFRYKTETTKQLYRRALHHFFEFTGPEFGVKDPSGWIAWAKAQPDILQVQDVIEKWGETRSPTAQIVNMAVIRSLSKHNGIVLPSGSGQRQVLKDWHRGYSREELRTLIGYLNTDILKLYVLIGKDSGLRAQDIVSLCYRHVKKDLEAGQKYVHLRLEPSYYNRRKASGLTFIGPNTVELLKKLIETGQISKEANAKFFKMSYSSLAESVRLAREKAGIDPTVQPSHGARKFFEGSLDRTGMDYHKKMQLEGHSQGTRIHYTDRDVDQLRALYDQAYPYLDLSEEGVVKSGVKDLQATVDSQKARIDELEKKLDHTHTRFLLSEAVSSKLILVGNKMGLEPEALARAIVETWSKMSREKKDEYEVGIKELEKREREKKEKEKAE